MCRAETRLIRRRIASALESGAYRAHSASDHPGSRISRMKYAYAN
ncbi:hypothetical protein [Lysobacter gummosus]